MKMHECRFESAGDRSKPVLVFLHGIGGGSRSWQPQLERFREHFFCIAWNMPGYGGREIVEPLTFENSARALAKDLEELGAKEAVLIGQSMGGMLAQVFYQEYPDRVAGLFLTATTAAFGKSDGDFQKQFVQSRTRPLDEGNSMRELAELVVPKLFTLNLSGETIEFAIDCMANVPEQTYRAALECIAGFDARDSLSQIECAVFLLAGENDPNVPMRVMQKMADTVDRSHFEVIAGGGHLLNLESPDKFNAALQSFVDSLTLKL